MIIIDEDYPFEFDSNSNVMSRYFHRNLVKNKYIDVKLRLKDVLFGAHSILLRKASPFFKKWFKHQKNVKITEAIIIDLDPNRVDRKTAESILRYIYTNKIILTQRNVKAICSAAHYFDIPALLKECERYMCSRIDRTNVLSYFLFSL